MKYIFVTVYTKEKGKLELTIKDWFDFDKNSITYHREDNPAIIYSDLRQEYWLNDRRHREDGHAIIYSDLRQEYWLNGKRHREDGHAVVFNNHDGSYYLGGEHYYTKAYYRKLKEIDNLPLSLQLTHEEEWVRERAKK